MVKEIERAEAQSVAQIPFAGQLSKVELCCNGIKFSMTQQYQTVARGTFIMEWYKMVPNPLLGWGLYSWWALVSGEKVVGGATPGGVCLTVASECETSQAVQFSVNQVGTTLISAI